MPGLNRIKKASDFLDSLPIDKQPIVTDCITNCEMNPNSNYGKWIIEIERLVNILGQENFE